MNYFKICYILYTINNFLNTKLINMVRIILKKSSLSPIVHEIPNPIIYALVFMSSYLTGELLLWCVKKLITRFQTKTSNIKSVENLRSADPARYNDPTRIKPGGAVDCLAPDASWLVISEQLAKKLTEILNPASINRNGTTPISPGVFFLAFTIVNKLELGQLAQTFGFDIANISVEVALEEVKKAGLSGIAGFALSFLLALVGPNVLAIRITLAMFTFCSGSVGFYKLQKMLEDVTCVPSGIIRELPASHKPNDKDKNPIFIAPNPIESGIKQFVVKGQESHNLYEEKESEVSCIPEFKQPQENFECVEDLDKSSCSAKPELKETCKVQKISSPLSQRTATLKDVIREDSSDVREETQKYTEAYEKKIEKYNKQQADAAERLKNKRIRIMESYQPSRKPTLQKVEESYETNFFE